MTLNCKKTDITPLEKRVQEADFGNVNASRRMILDWVKNLRTRLELDIIFDRPLLPLNPNTISGQIEGLLRGEYDLC